MWVLLNVCGPRGAAAPEISGYLEFFKTAFASERYPNNWQILGIIFLRTTCLRKLFPTRSRLHGNEPQISMSAVTSAPWSPFGG